MFKPMRSMTARDWWVFMTSPKGRVGRYDYNIKFLLVFFILGLIAGIIDYSYLGASIKDPNQTKYATTFVQLLSLWPSLALAIKRLHDMNYRGWWLVVGYVLPVVIGSGFIGYFMAHQNVLGGVAVGLLIIAIILTFMIILCCAKGTIGPNRFGSDPSKTTDDVEGIPT